MLSLYFLIALWHLQVFCLRVHALALSKQNGDLAPPESRVLTPPSPPYYPPPEPWDEHVCRDLSTYPDFYLTFSWGTTISREALSGLLIASRRTLRLIIEEGHGNDYLPLHTGSIVVPYRGVLLLAARPYGYEHFTYKQILDAIDLLRLCGLDKGHRDEMWAYAFVGPKRVGEISIQIGMRSISNGNRTSVVETS